jgi:hypothetical protein
VRNISISEQADLNNIAADLEGCFTLEGDIVISSDSDLDLSALFNIWTLDGNLFIYNNTNLKDLDGLDNIGEVTGNVYIYQNSALESIEGLSRLQQVGGNFELHTHPKLESLKGLGNLGSVGGYFQMFSNDLIKNLDDLTDFGGAGSYVEISLHPNLEDISKIRNISSPEIIIHQNPKLDNCCCAIPVFENVPRLSLMGNGVNCNSLQAIKDYCSQSPFCVPCDISISQQSQVDNFQTDYGDCSILEGNLRINGNTRITNLLGLSSLEVIRGDLTLFGSSALSNLEGLNNIDSIYGDIIVEENDFENFKGLDDLKYVGGRFILYQNPGLKNLEGLKNLQYVGGWFHVYDNPLFSSLDGVNELIRVGELYGEEGGNFAAYDNPKLQDCCIATKLENINGEPYFARNAIGCESLEDIEENGGCITIFELPMLQLLDKIIIAAFILIIFTYIIFKETNF